MPEASVILAIEISQREGGVAIRDASGKVHVEPLEGRGAGDRLMAAIAGLFGNAGLSPRDLAGIGVSIGPGGFTGLRIAIATAKMLGETLGAPIAAVPGALVAAESYEGPGPIAVALAVKRDTVWLTRLKRNEQGEWRIEGTPQIVKASALDVRGVEVVLADRHLPAEARAGCERAGVAIVEPRFEPRACLRIAAAMLGRGEAIAPANLAPLYAREPEAVSLWRTRKAD